jgi:Ni/Co efflux regulator RcnB
MSCPLPDAILLALVAALAVGGASAGDEPPASDPEQRQQYLEAEARRAAARDNRDYGRYDRADLNRSREAACRRQANAPGGFWRVGGYVDMRDRRFQEVRDPRGYGLRRPPNGARWMCADSGDLLLVIVASGLVSELIPHD